MSGETVHGWCEVARQAAALLVLRLTHRTHDFEHEVSMPETDAAESKRLPSHNE
jgi:hypothetical protein